MKPQGNSQLNLPSQNQTRVAREREGGGGGGGGGVCGSGVDGGRGSLVWQIITESCSRLLQVGMAQTHPH